MKKNLILFGVAVFLLAGVIVGLKEINSKQAEYSLNTKQIEQINLDKQVTNDITVKFSNTKCSNRRRFLLRIPVPLY